MKFVPIKVSRKVAMAALKTQKHSPTLLFAGGVVGVIGTVVLASKATLRLDDEILVTVEDKLEQIKAHADVTGSDAYSDKDILHDKTVVYTQAAIKIAKLYGPALCLGVVSIGMLAGSHRILSKRNAALTAAYAGLDKAFREYRGRVIDELGEEREQRIWAPTETVIETDADGKKVKVERSTGKGGSPYAVVFDETNPNWNRELEFNQFFLASQLTYANERLRARGFLFLNDVYQALGFPVTKDGQVVGWLADGTGDGYVSFGIFDENNEIQGSKFVSGEERSVWLDFNVDGNVLDKIWSK